MATCYKVKTVPLSKYGTTTLAELGIRCTFCYAGSKTFESAKGSVTVSEHYNPKVHCVTVDGTANGKKVFKSFDETCRDAFWQGCDYAKDLLKTTDVEPTVKPRYES